MSLFGKKDGDKTKATETPKHPDLGRNDPCHCGSGKKYKKCCMAKDEAAERTVLDEQWAKASKDQAKEEEQTDKKTKETPPANTKPASNSPNVTKRHQTIV